ncbi:hypothetical protein SAMN05216548_102198 [Faunimonas pinastri]|uniref:Secreted protein n=1 Tax=Faunimonas pinastri TaxID=1855383 RepID=A0A1H9CN37_9HYPH|nr:hypothetical protein [Faunimonas pinastri]SEQ02491.1 hypothetical protein SAMN05216548_102198 [Faunimonas pinastri]
MRLSVMLFMACALSAPGLARAEDDGLELPLPTPIHAHDEEKAVRVGSATLCEHHRPLDDMAAQRSCIHKNVEAWRQVVTLAGSGTASILAMTPLRQCAGISDDDARTVAVDWRRVLACWLN